MSRSPYRMSTVQASGEAFRPQNMKILHIFLFLSVGFAFLSWIRIQAIRINADPDPDSLHCYKHISYNLILHCNKKITNVYVRAIA
jgi:hypothetical protein